MKNLFILMLSVFLLAWCSHQINLWNTITNSGLVTSQWEEDISDEFWSIIYSRASVTWIVEANDGTPLFLQLQDHVGCVVDTGGIGESRRVYCDWISGYNHFYKIPSLNLEYSIIGSDSYYYEAFLTESGSFSPILSGNILYQPRDTKSYILKKQKRLTDKPIDIIQAMKLGFGCKSEEMSSDELFSWYVTYTVPAYINYDPSSWVRCLENLPSDWWNIWWYYIFSPADMNYYYIVGLNGENGMSSIYTNKSLKLFVE